MPSTNTLLKFQEHGVQFLCDQPYAILADEMGLGKTVQAVVACQKRKAQQVLVVCPASVKYVWYDEFKKWAPEYDIEIAFGRRARISKRLHSDTGRPSVLIINYELLVGLPVYRQLIDCRFSVGIFDEAQKLQGRKSLRTAAVLKRGAIGSRCKRLWFLTGTPVSNRPIEMYPILKAIAPKMLEPYTTYTAFAKQFCGGHFDGYQFFDKGATNLEDLRQRLDSSGIMLRRLKKDVLKDLPDKRYQIIDIEPLGLKAKELIEREFTWSRKDAEYQDLHVQDGGEIALLRHDLGMEKVRKVVNHVKTILESKKKVVVFAYHRDVIKALKLFLNDYHPVVVQGGMSAEAKNKEVQRFQNDSMYEVFIGQITAAGVGLTLTAADTAVFAEISWVPGEIEQAVDRVHRITQTKGVLIQFLVFKDSLDEHMLRININKKQIIDQIIKPTGEELLQ